MIKDLPAGLTELLTSLAQVGRERQPRAGVTTKRIALALQGGGAHGAFTWGVLDHLLADGRLSISGISGTSAGAINAVMLADGLARGGPQEARARLAAFWQAASLNGDLPPLQRAALSRLFSLLPGSGTPLTAWFSALTRYLSPYDLNPLNINPLKGLIERFVDFDAVRGLPDLDLFVTATNVHTGRLRVFDRREMTADVVMASAALPLLFRAVEIDGVPYWDGGYTGNPAFFPLLGGDGATDILLVQITPLQRPSTPTAARDIIHRINEITFNASLEAELRALALLNRVLEDNALRRGRGCDDYRPVNLHRIVLADEAKALPPASRLQNDYDFFTALHAAGVEAARVFLATHFDDIGAHSTFDPNIELVVEAA